MNSVRPACRPRMLSASSCYLHRVQVRSFGLLPAISPDYGVSGSAVVWINGVGGGIIMALGCLAGGWIPASFDRRIACAAPGALNALALLLSGSRASQRSCLHGGNRCLSLRYRAHIECVDGSRSGHRARRREERQLAILDAECAFVFADRVYELGRGASRSHLWLSCSSDDGGHQLTPRPAAPPGMAGLARPCEHAARGQRGA
jgi:hypothetical protein